MCWGRLGRPKQAETRYRRALVLRPDFAAAWLNLGNLLREQGREVHAEAALLRAVELRPDLVPGWLNLALLERTRRHPDAAEAHLRKAFQLDPGHIDTLVSWCQFRTAERDLAGAWGWLRWALLRDPDHADAVNAHGILLHTEGRFAEAVEVFARAEGHGQPPRFFQSWQFPARPGPNGRSPCKPTRRPSSAIRTAPEARYNLALTQLRLGDWEQGWPGYEARWGFPRSSPPAAALRAAALAG